MFIEGFELKNRLNPKLRLPVGSNMVILNCQTMHNSLIQNFYKLDMQIKIAIFSPAKQIIILSSKKSNLCKISRSFRM